jgi:excisionase family DNA binding protein
MGELLTVEEAAGVARCDQRLIRRAIKQGELEGLFSSRWLLARGELEKWMRSRARRQAPRPAPQRRQRAGKPRDGRPGSVVRLSEMRGEQA